MAPNMRSKQKRKNQPRSKTARVFDEETCNQQKVGQDPPKRTESSNTLATFASGSSLSSRDKESPRIELFFTSPTQLRQRVRLLQSHGYQKFNLVNKNNNERDSLVEWTQIIREECPTADIGVHFSLKCNRSGANSGRGNSNAVSANTEILQDFTQRAHGQANEILIVSGGHSPSKPRPRWNTVTALVKLTECCTTRPVFAVAYNPYLPNIQEEIKRLEQKLKTRLVSKVYLQFGSDLVKLKAALEQLSSYSNIQLAGSVFLPTPQLLRQQKARPWNGVFLSEAFLDSPKEARHVVVQMISLYKRHKVELLWEAPGVRTEEDLQLMSGLMVQAENVESRDNDNEEMETGEAKCEIGSDEEAWDDASFSSFDAAHNENKIDNGSLTHVKRQVVRKESSSLSPVLDSTCLLLFGSHDLRLYDNLAVQEACQRHARVVPIFLWSPTVIESGGIRAEALEVLIKDAVMNLRKELQAFGLDLMLRYAPTDADIQKQMSDLLQLTKASAIYYNRDFTPHGRHVKEERSKLLKEFPGVEHWGFQSVLLWDVDQVPLTEGFPSTSYWGTLIPFLKACEHFFGYPRRPVPKANTVTLLKRTQGPSSWPHSDPNLPIAVLRPKVRPWHQPIRDCFPDMSHNGAHELMEKFFESKSSGFRRYGYERHRADKERATSRLSVHLRLGTMSPNELYWRHQDHPMEWEEKKVFCRRLAWRDLAYFHLRCFPNYAYMPVRVHYQNTLWIKGEEAHRRLEAWKWGKTGYPIVDAGMRELWTTGYMQQNIRMIAASFLVEHLRVHWVKGCEWFHYTLVDADTAINAMMWQNAGKCGVDQWSFVPSPVSASQDPTGRYTKRWVPELSKLPLELLHRPWETPPVILERYGIFLGDNYPHRIVTELDRERARSVENVVNMRRKAPYFNDERGCDVIVLPNGQSRSVYTTREYRIMKNGRTLPPPKEEKQGLTHKERLRARRPKSVAVTS